MQPEHQPLPAELMPRQGMSLARQYMQDPANPKTLADPDQVQEFERNGRTVVECIWTHWLGVEERAETIHGKVMWAIDDPNEPQFHSNFNPADEQGMVVARYRVAKAFDAYYSGR